MATRMATSRDSQTITYKTFAHNDNYYLPLEDAFNSAAVTVEPAFPYDDLLEAIYSKYYMQDINIPSKGINKTYTNDEVKEFTDDMVRIFILKLPYYHELITNYNKAYDYATGNKRRTHRVDEYHREGENSNTSTNNDTHTDYELPNKVTDTTYKSTPSAMNTDVGNGTNVGSNSSDTTGTSDIEVTYDNEFLDLKRKYLNQIRNVIEEFADEFKECFYSIYYTGCVKEED